MNKRTVQQRRRLHCSLPPDVCGFFVLAQADELRMPQMIVGRPLEESAQSRLESGRFNK